LCPLYSRCEIEVYWEEGYDEWFVADVESVNAAKGTASIFYPESDELEKNADMLLLIKQGWVRLREYVGGEGPGEGDEGDRKAKSKAKRRRVESSDDDEDDLIIEEDEGDARRPGKAAVRKPSEGGAAPPKRPKVEPAATPGGKRAAVLQRPSTSLLAGERHVSKAGGSKPTAAGGSARPSGGVAAAAAAPRAPPPSLSDEALRGKVRKDFLKAFETAAEERGTANTSAPSTSDPAAAAPALSPGPLAAELEACLFTDCGGTSREYKEKFRSLLYNLSNAANRDFRGGILAGELRPAAVVRMNEQQWASAEERRRLAALREELDKARVLDLERAALMNTTAAEQYGQEMKKMGKIAGRTQAANEDDVEKAAAQMGKCGRWGRGGRSRHAHKLPHM
jgi:hypothetical protein